MSLFETLTKSGIPNACCDDSDKRSNNNMIRKVRSLDFSRLVRRSSATETYQSSSTAAASKFSKDAHCGRFSSSWRSRSSTRLSGDETGSCSNFSEPVTNYTDSLAPVERQESGFLWLMGNRRTPLSLGYLSVLVLLFVTATDLALNVVNAQIHQLDSPLNYDALSMEVISPPFKYKSALTGERPRLGLGTAAISSVTTALSPILPFTGGVDLRREEHWEGGGWFHSISSIVEQVRDAFGLEQSGTLLSSSIPRGGGNAPPLVSKQPRKKKGPKHNAALSTSKPFVPVDDIAEMSLSDVTTAFRYSIEKNRADFDESRFLKGLPSRMKKVLTAMDVSTSVSRGKDVKPASTDKRSSQNARISEDEFGNVDALQFCAAMRIFAEWRVVRQVPHGYKGYAVGMNLGHKDVVQNVAKIENAVHDWIDHNRAVQASTDAPREALRSPTLRELLQHEIETQVHPSLPRLKDKTAAMGLLWVRRQLNYQTAIFANVIGVPEMFTSTSAAVTAAYKEVYDKYHGWAVQKIFNYSFQAAPEAEEIYKFMNPSQLKRVVEKARSMPALRQEFGQEPPQGSDDSMNPLERFGRHVVSEWDKLVSGVVDVFDKKDNVNVRGGASPIVQPDGDAFESFVRQEMAKDAHQRILVYLDVAKPLLSDLAGLFDDLNMDDPSKV